MKLKIDDTVYEKKLPFWETLSHGVHQIYVIQDGLISDPKIITVNKQDNVKIKLSDFKKWNNYVCN